MFLDDKKRISPSKKYLEVSYHILGQQTFYMCCTEQLSEPHSFDAARSIVADNLNCKYTEINWSAKSFGRKSGKQLSRQISFDRV